MSAQGPGENFGSMERTAHGNWIGGRWTASADERAFAVRSLIDGTELGSWPRSSAADARAALSLLAREPLGERTLRKVRSAVAALPRALHPFEDELAAHLSDLLGVGEQENGWRRARIDAPAAHGPRRGPVILLAHWSEFASGLTQRICTSLMEGHSVLCLSDSRLPLAAELAARVLESLGLTGEVFALLHADAEDVLNELLSREEELGGLNVVSSAEHIPRLRSRWDSADGFTGSSPGNASAVVGADEDPGAAARRIAEAAWGRSSTMSGQLPGQIARVMCHEARFSRFTEELLKELSCNPDVRRPVPAIEQEAPARVRKARELGLDGGAALIFSERMGETDFCVFTNVEPEHYLASLRAPAPVLALMRASTDEEAARIAAELDAAG